MKAYSIMELTKRHPRSAARAALWLTALAALLWPIHVRAATLVIVLSGDAAPYAQAESGCRGILEEQKHTVRTVQLKELTDNGLDAIGKPTDAVIAIGTPAAVYLHMQLPASIPLLYCMVSNPAAARLTEGNKICGVTTDIPMKCQIPLISQVLPKAREFGILYRSDTPDGQRLLKSVQNNLPNGWKLHAVAVDKHDSMATAIDDLVSQHVDIIWTAFDPHVYDTAAVRSLLLAALRADVPVFGFSPSIVHAGALLGTGVDPKGQGQQVAGLALRWLANPSDPTLLPTQPADGFLIAINQIVADKLSIQLPADLLERAAFVFKGDE